jgi:hypothetical protein
MALSLRMPAMGNNSTCLRFVRVGSCRPQASGLSWAVEGTLDEPIGEDEMFCMKVRCPLIHAIEEGPWSVSVRNVSRTGVGLIAERPFPRGALLTVQLPKGKDRLARVVHTRRLEGTWWWVTGGALLAPLSGNELKRML